MCTQQPLEIILYYYIIIILFFTIFPSVTSLHFFSTLLHLHRAVVSLRACCCAVGHPTLRAFTSACILSLILSVKALLSIIGADKEWSAAEYALQLPDHATSALLSQRAECTLWEIDVRPFSVGADFFIYSSSSFFLAIHILLSTALIELAQSMAHAESATSSSSPFIWQ